MSRLVSGVVGLIAGAAIGGLLAGGLVALTSTNTHDRGQEIAMTTAFVGIPFGALAGLVAGLLRKSRA